MAKASWNGLDDIVCGIMAEPRIVLDTNVVVSAFRSRRGPAFRLLSLVGRDRFEISVSVPLVLEYEDVLQRATSLSEHEVFEILRYLCSIARQQKIYYLWRPVLPDPKDDMVLELAVASRSQYLVTYNQRDFSEALRFGIQVLTPEAFLVVVGG